jgi:hypothetical protein
VQQATGDEEVASSDTIFPSCEEDLITNDSNAAGELKNITLGGRVLSITNELNNVDPHVMTDPT